MRGLVSAVPKDVGIHSVIHTFAPAVEDFHLDFGYPRVRHVRGEQVVDAVAVGRKDREADHQ